MAIATSQRVVGLAVQALVRAAFVLVSSFVVPAQAQSPVLAWQRSIPASGNVDTLPAGGDPNVAKRALVVDAAGNAYVTGVSTNGYNKDFLTLKFDPNGNLLWRKLANGAFNGDDVGYAVAVDGAGHVAVTGSSQTGSGSASMTVKYDAAGNELWRAVSGGAAGNDVSIDVAFAPNGDVVVTGTVQGATGYNYATQRYAAATGATLWSAEFDGVDLATDRASALAVNATGDVYVTGFTTRNGGFDFVTLKYDANDGSLVASPAYINGASGGTDIALDLKLDANGNAYVAGSTWNGANNDFMVVKYSAVLGKLWEATYDGAANANDVAHTLEVDSAGNVYVMGSADQSYSQPQGVGNPQVIVVKYNASGQLQWVRGMNGAGNGESVATGLALDGAGQVLAGAYANGPQGNVLALHRFDATGVLQDVARIDGAPATSSSRIVAVRRGPMDSVVMLGSKGNGEDSDLIVAKAVTTVGMPLSYTWMRDEGNAENLPTRFGSGLAGARALAIDSAGNAFVTGQASGVGRGDVITAKLDAAGNLAWRTLSKGASAAVDRGVAVAADGAGGAFVAADSTAGATSDLMVLKLSSSGGEAWRATVNAPQSGRDFANAIAIDGAGHVVVAGTTGVTGSATRDMLFSKRNGSNGAELWRSQYNGAGNGNDVPAALVIDGANAVLAIGTAYDGTQDVMVVQKFPAACASACAPSWASSAGVGNASATVVTLDSAGNAIGAGSALMKTGSGGVLAWSVQPGFTAQDIALGPQDTIVAGGSNGNVAKFDAMGNVLWRVFVNGFDNEADLVTGVAVDSAGGVYALNARPANELSNYTLFKFDAIGTMLWSLDLSAAGATYGIRPQLRIGVDRALYIAGNASFGGVSAMSVWKVTQPPPPPTLNGAVVGNGSASIYYTPPASDGGSPITAYQLNCNNGAVLAGLGASPAALSGLSNGVTYVCELRATNAFGTSIASNSVSFTPQALPPLAIVDAWSARTHGASGEHRIRIDFFKDVTGDLSIEPRAAEAGHHLRLRFNAAVTAIASVEVKDESGAGAGSASASIDMGELQLTVAPDGEARRIKLQLNGLVGGAAGTENLVLSYGVLVGDANGSGRVTAADIAAIKARSGQMTTSTSYKLDLDGNGTINAVDLMRAKGKAGWVLP